MKNQRGITLIALVITIIVLLILAGVSIAMLTGDNGILSNATRAVAENNIAEDKESAALDLNAAYTDYMAAKYVDNEEGITTFLAFLQDNSTEYMKDTTHYTFESDSGKITTKSTNNEGKTEETTVNENGGITGWTVTGAAAPGVGG